MVYLLKKNLKTRKKNKNFDYIKVKPFFIKAKKKPSAINLSYPNMPKYKFYFICCY